MPENINPKATPRYRSYIRGNLSLSDVEKLLSKSTRKTAVTGNFDTNRFTIQTGKFSTDQYAAKTLKKMAGPSTIQLKGKGKFLSEALKDLLTIFKP
jgi:flagellum-specific peptidoglycan hydrolase FlgJ